MPPTIYRDQIERFYELEESGRYSKGDVGALCRLAMATCQRYRRELPYPEDFEQRPIGALGLPAMREPKAVRTNPASWFEDPNGPPRAKRPGPKPPPPPPDPSAPVPGPLPAPPTPGRKPSKLLQQAEGITAKRPVRPAVRPVNSAELQRVVFREVKAARAELLKEVKAASFDPAVTWTTEVDHVAFDPIKALVQLAHVPGCPENTILGILRTLVALRKERAKVAWETVKLEDIPQEHRPRLAGQLAEWLHVSELPVEVQEHEAVREVYELTGVALPKPAEAEAFLLRWEQTLEDMRTDAEARTVAEKARGVLVMDGPPKVAAEFRVRPSTGAGST